MPEPEGARPAVCRSGPVAHASTAGSRFVTLTQRGDFIAASRAKRQAMPGFILQARRRAPSEQIPDDIIRVGYTCSKKVGNAVARNRAKRRLRAIARDTLPALGRPGWDYVLIGRAGITGTLPFAQLTAQLQQALSKLGDKPRR